MFSLHINVFNLFFSVTPVMLFLLIQVLCD